MTLPCYATGYSSVEDCDSEPDAVEDYNGNRLGAAAFEYTSSGRDLVYEDQEPYLKNTPIEHMKTFYTDFDQMRHEKYDGMIITGAPVEQMDFEEVTLLG